MSQAVPTLPGVVYRNSKIIENNLRRYGLQRGLLVFRDRRYILFQQVVEQQRFSRIGRAHETHSQAGLNDTLFRHIKFGRHFVRGRQELFFGLSFNNGSIAVIELSGVLFREEFGLFNGQRGNSWFFGQRKKFLGELYHLE